MPKEACRGSPVDCFGKALNSHLFVGIDLEDFVQLSDLQDAKNLFRGIQKLQRATLGHYRRVGANQFADSRTVYSLHFAQIEEDFGLATRD